MKTLFLMLVIGPCLLAQAADPNDNTPTEKKIIVTTVKEAVKLPAATADKTPDFNITVVETADPTAKKLNLKTATVEGVRALADKKPMKFVLTTVDAAKPTPFKDKIVRVQAVAANRTEIFTLENVKLTTLLGSNFITGTAVKYRNDRYSGSEVYLNLRDVLTIVAMTPEQAKKFNEARPRRPSSRPYVSPQGPYNPPQRGPSVLEGGPPLPGQRPFNPYTPPGAYPQPGGPPQRGPSILEGGPPLPGQRPLYPPGFNPQQPGQGPYTPQPGFNLPQGYNPPQGGQGQSNPPQPPRYNSPQGGPGQSNPPQPPGYNPPQEGQPDRNQPQEPNDPESR